MNLFLTLNQPDFNFKTVQNSNSTIDAQSLQEEPFSHWEPLWFQIQSSEKFPHALNICPACTKYVSPTEEILACENPHGRIYLAHSMCTSDIFQFTEYGCNAKKIQSKQVLINTSHRIGCHEYLVQLIIEHPLSPKKFYQTSRKMLERQKKLTFDVNELNTEYFEPNTIVLPLKQFKVCVKIIPLFSSQQNHKHTLYFRVDLSKQEQGARIIKFQQNNIAFIGEFQIVQTLQMKKQIIENMNYKYKRPFTIENFVKLNSFFIEFKDQESQLNPEIPSSPPKYEIKREEQLTEALQIKANSYGVFSSQVSVHEQIQSGNQFLNTIKTQVGSKQFQKKVKNMRNEEIQGIINQILPHLEEIILNDYANYMFQSLVGTCTFEQRMKIILKVADILTRLVCQQQGTFVFQQLIAFLTTEKQFYTLCQPVAKDFKIIAMDNYGNHFLRKLIQNIPKQMISNIMPEVLRNFLDFAKNKNAVCVMKCVLRALLQGEPLNNEIAHHLKKFLDTLTLNTQQLINDEYGNYLIQQAYQLVQLDRLGGISQYIINFFMNCSCEKFSSNVVLNCVKKYWKNTMMPYKALKQTLENRNISYMYQNKEGNKILLQIMELPMELSVKDKINSVLRNEQASKYNNRRWVSVTGKCKTGAVGTNYTSFSEAISFVKRKPYN